LDRKKGSEEMGSTWDTVVKIAKGMLILNFIVAVISYFIFDSWAPFITGLLFGTIIAVLNFRLLSITLEKSVKMLPHQAQKYVASRYIIRFLLEGAVLFISLKADYINILGTIFGLISLKLIILKTEVFNNFKFYNNIIKRKEEK